MTPAVTVRRPVAMSSEDGMSEREDDPERADSAKTEGGRKGAADDRDREDYQNDKDTEGEDGEKDGDDGEKKPSPLANPKVRIALIVLAVFALIAGIAWYIHNRTYSRFQQSTNDAYLGADQVHIAPRVSGYVQEVLVSDNQVIKAGQVLARISSEDYQATADQSRAKIAEGEASVAQAQAQRQMQFDTIRQNLAKADQSRAMLRQYQATSRFNADQVARYTPLSLAGAETDEKLAQVRSDLKSSVAQADSANAQLSASNAEVAAARHQIAYYDAQIRSGEAQAAGARAQLAGNMVDVRAATVTSTIGGRIGDLTVRVGQYIQAGTRMMTVVPVEGLYLTANFKETQIGLMRIGQPVSVKIDALTGEPLHGVVESFSPGTGSRFALVPTDNATGNFTKIVQRVAVRIRVDAGSEARKVLVPGLSATVSVDTRGARDDTQARKDETARSKDEQKHQHDQELQQDKAQPRVGAGR